MGYLATTPDELAEPVDGHGKHTPSDRPPGQQLVIPAALCPPPAQESASYRLKAGLWKYPSRLQHDVLVDVGSGSIAPYRLPWATIAMSVVPRLRPEVARRCMQHVVKVPFATGPESEIKVGIVWGCGRAVSGLVAKLMPKCASDRKCLAREFRIDKRSPALRGRPRTPRYHR